jgi:hypothetical protein
MQFLWKLFTFPFCLALRLLRDGIDRLAWYITLAIYQLLAALLSCFEPLMAPFNYSARYLASFVVRLIKYCILLVIFIGNALVLAIFLYFVAYWILVPSVIAQRPLYFDFGYQLLSWEACFPHATLKLFVQRQSKASPHAFVKIAGEKDGFAPSPGHAYEFKVDLVMPESNENLKAGTQQFCFVWNSMRLLISTHLRHVHGHYFTLCTGWAIFVQL